MLLSRKVRKTHPAAIVRMAQIQRKQILNHDAAPSTAFRLPRPRRQRKAFVSRRSRLADPRKKRPSVKASIVHSSARLEPNCPQTISK